MHAAVQRYGEHCASLPRCAALITMLSMHPSTAQRLAAHAAWPVMTALPTPELLSLNNYELKQFSKKL